MTITTASAKILIEITLQNLGSWGPDCKLSQVHDQATQAARLEAHKLLPPGSHAKVSISDLTLQVKK